MPCFKSDIHHVVNAFKLNTKQDLLKINLLLSDNSVFTLDLDNFYLTDLDKYAKKNINIPAKEKIIDVVDPTIEIVNKDTVSHPIIVREKSVLDESETSIAGDEEDNKPIK